jgi:hypothetical protein
VAKRFSSCWNTNCFVPMRWMIASWIQMFVEIIYRRVLFWFEALLPHSNLVILDNPQLFFNRFGG